MTAFYSFLALYSCTCLLYALGVGTWIAGDGSWVYGGDVNQGCRTGRGSLCFFTHGVERATFVGSFKNGEPHGKCLHHDYAGNFYTGTWKDGKPEGKGMLVHRGLGIHSC